MTPEEMLEYLQQHVRKDGDCLIWAGPYAGGMSHAEIRWNNKRYTCRRLYLSLKGTPLPPNRVIYPKCGSHLCMNETHWMILTPSQFRTKVAKNSTNTNRSLAVALGRAKNAKLPITEYGNVARMRAEGKSYAAIGELYGVTPTRVQKALKSWERSGLDPWRMQS